MPSYEPTIGPDGRPLEQEQAGEFYRGQAVPMGDSFYRGGFGDALPQGAYPGFSQYGQTQTQPSQEFYGSSQGDRAIFSGLSQESYSDYRSQGVSQTSQQSQDF